MFQKPDELKAKNVTGVSSFWNDEEDWIRIAVLSFASALAVLPVSDYKENREISIKITTLFKREPGE